MKWWEKLKAKLFKPQKPVSAMQHLQRGLGKFAIGDFTGALHEWDLAIQADAAFFPAYYHRALLLEEQGEIEQAVQDLLVALDLAEQAGDREHSKKIRQALARIHRKLENSAS